MTETPTPEPGPEPPPEFDSSPAGAIQREIEVIEREIEAARRRIENSRDVITRNEAVVSILTDRLERHKAAVAALREYRI